MKNKTILTLGIILTSIIVFACSKLNLTEKIRGTWKTDFVVSYEDGTKEYRTVYDTFQSDGSSDNIFTEYTFGGGSIDEATPEGKHVYSCIIKGRWKIDGGDLYKEYDLSTMEVDMGADYQSLDKTILYKSMFRHYKTLSDNSKTPLKDLIIEERELSYDEGNIDRTVFKKSDGIEKYIKAIRTVSSQGKSVDANVSVTTASATTTEVPKSVRDILTNRIYEWDRRFDYDLESSINDLYANKVLFYGKQCTRAEIFNIVSKLLEKTPDFGQDCVDLRFTQINSVTVRCDFNKVTMSNEKEKSYPSYLYFQNINGVWRITQESDAVTDHNLTKKTK